MPGPKIVTWSRCDQKIECTFVLPQTTTINTIDTIHNINTRSRFDLRQCIIKRKNVAPDITSLLPTLSGVLLTHKTRLTGQYKLLDICCKSMSACWCFYILCFEVVQHRIGMEEIDMVHRCKEFFSESSVFPCIFRTVESRIANIATLCNFCNAVVPG